MSALTLIMEALAYDDVQVTSNPKQIRIQRQPSVTNLSVDNPGCIPVPLAPGEVKTVIDGTRSTSIDNTTEFFLELSSISATTYRLTWTAGTAPAFRTARVVPVDGVELTLAVQANLTMTVTAGAGTPFSTVVAGDQVLIPGASTGDPASPFDALNEGSWSVLTATGAVLTLVRAAGTVFSGASEAVTPDSDSEFLVFTSAGVQAGDTINITAGFATTTRHPYEVTAVTSGWLEFSSTAPLGEESDIAPGAAGIAIYTAAKRFVMIETDQEIVVRTNGDTSSLNRVTPWLAGYPTLMGLHVTTGPCWELEIENVSTANANVTVSSAE